MGEVIPVVLLAAAIATVAWVLGYARGHRIATESAPPVRFSTADQAFFQKRVQQMQARVQRFDQLTTAVKELLLAHPEGSSEHRAAMDTMRLVLVCHEEIAAMLEWTVLYEHAVKSGWTVQSGEPLTDWFIRNMELAHG